MSSFALSQVSHASPVVQESQQADPRWIEVAKKVSYYVGLAFLGLGMVLVTGGLGLGSIALLWSTNTISISATSLLLLKISGIGLTAGIFFLAFGKCLTLPYSHVLRVQELGKDNLAELTREHMDSMGAWRTTRHYVEFSWSEVVRHYGRNFDRLKARIQREMQEAEKPFIYAYQICESLAFTTKDSRRCPEEQELKQILETAKDSQLSPDEQRVKQIVQEILQERIRGMTVREMIPCFSVNRPLDYAKLEELRHFKVIPDGLCDLLLQALDTQTALNQRVDQCEAEFSEREKRLNALLDVMPREEIAQHLDGLQRELERLRQEKDNNLAAFREEAGDAFARIDRDWQEALAGRFN